MDLLERYLAAVARDLPEKQRADVVAELRDSLLSMIEDAEARLGRPQTRAELEAMLVAFGRPLQVAGRYRKTQYLIGPDVFPFWWAWLRAGLAIVAAVYVSLAVLSVFSVGGVTDEIGDMTPSLSFALIFTFGAVTLAAAAIERWGKPHFLTQWKPRDLPPAGGKPPSRFELVFELCASLVFVAWWVGLIHFDNWLPVAEVRVDLAPVWKLWFWPILAYAVVDVIAHGIALARPGRTRLYLVLSVARCLFGAAVLAAIFRTGHFVELSGASVSSELQDNFDQGVAIGIVCTMFGLLVRAAWDTWRLWFSARPPRVGVTLTA